MTHKMHNAVYAAIDEIAKAEKITRKVLGQISRDLLVYVPESEDIEAVNRLLNILTPTNRKHAILYFKHFLPWQVEKDTDGNFQRFGKKHKGEKTVAKKMQMITDWLSVKTHTIWDFEIEIEPKRKDFFKNVSRTITKALEGDEKTDTPALTREQIMLAIFDGGVTLEDMMTTVEEMQAEVDEVEEEFADAA